MNHEYYMQKSFELAKHGLGLVSPNPLVGSVIVKDDCIIGAGFHERYGHNHAELNAIVSAQQSLEGTTLYCNLEPCCHTNKQTAPCAQRIIKEKIARVVIANKDPNPHVDGSGIALLKQAGIEVIEGICQEEGALLNEVFFTYQRKKRPFIHLKYAQTLDGNIACVSGDSKWITHEKARTKVHEMRLKYDAILIGAGTLIADNPQLSIRLVDSEKKCSRRIILGSLGYIEPHHLVVSDEYNNKTILVTHDQDLANHELKAEIFRKNGITIMIVDVDKGFLNLHQVCQKLAALNITSILVEGGSKILTSFIREQLVDRISIFIAPKIIGAGIGAINELGIQKMADAFTFENTSYEMIDGVIHFSGKPAGLLDSPYSSLEANGSSVRPDGAPKARVEGYEPILKDQLCLPD